MQRNWKIQEGTLQNPSSSAPGAAFLTSYVASAQNQITAGGMLGAAREEGWRGNGRGIARRQNAHILTRSGWVTTAYAVPLVKNTVIKTHSGSGLYFMIHKEKVELWYHFCLARERVLNSIISTARSESDPPSPN